MCIVLVVVVLCVLLSYVYLLYYVGIAFFFNLDCWLEVSIRKVLRPTISTQVFLGFFVLKTNAEMVSKIPSCHYILLM